MSASAPQVVGPKVNSRLATNMASKARTTGARCQQAIASSTPASTNTLMTGTLRRASKTCPVNSQART